MSIKLKRYVSMLALVIHEVELRRSRTLEDISKKDPTDFDTGQLVALDYFLGIIPRLALDHGIPPYLGDLDDETIYQYHQKQKEAEVLRSYRSYIKAFISVCLEQYKIAVKKPEQIKKEGEFIIWDGICWEYDYILEIIHRNAYVSKIPIPGFLSKEEAESNDIPNYSNPQQFLKKSQTTGTK